MDVAAGYAALRPVAEQLRVPLSGAQKQPACLVYGPRTLTAPLVRAGRRTCVEDAVKLMDPGRGDRRSSTKELALNMR